MIKTPLHQNHLELKAKMGPFAGYEMPLSYEGVLIEHKAVREAAGLFDVSHMGQIFIEGESAIDLIQWLCTNDATRLKPGKAQYSCLTNPDGGVIDDLIVYCFSPVKYMLVVNAANIDRDWEWIQAQNRFNAVLTNASSKWALLALQGPRANEILQPLTGVALDQIPFYQFTQGIVANCPDVIVSATGYTGSGGFELYCLNEYAQTLWQDILESGREMGIKPAGLAARNTLRLEMGYCLHGNELDENITPIAAGLGWITKFTKDFVGRELLENIKVHGPELCLAGFKMLERGVPRKGYDIVDSNGNLLGTVTSGSIAPSLDESIGLGYVPPIFAEEGSIIYIRIRKKTIPATVTKIPFYKKPV